MVALCRAAEIECPQDIQTLLSTLRPYPHPLQCRAPQEGVQLQRARSFSWSPASWWNQCCSANHIATETDMRTGEKYMCQISVVGTQREPNDAFLCCLKPHLLNIFLKINICMKKQSLTS